VLNACNTAFAASVDSDLAIVRLAKLYVTFFLMYSKIFIYESTTNRRMLDKLRTMSKNTCLDLPAVIGCRKRYKDGLCVFDFLHDNSKGLKPGSPNLMYS